MDMRPIGVFDSGLGGLTAVHSLWKILPEENLIYFGDTARVPYGGRSKETILKYARQDVRFLRSFDLKAILIACGTVTTTSLDTLQTENDLPIVGVVEPTCRRALLVTKTKKVGMIATLASVRSGAYEATLRRLDPTVEVICKPCPLFVPLVENGYVDADNPVTKMVIAEYLQELRDKNVDTLILGCTHYPLIKRMIGEFMGDAVTLIDSGKVTAQATAAALDDLGLLNGRKTGGSAQFFVSYVPYEFARQARMFLGEYAGSGDVPVERIAIESY